jgi:hypothetical protein
LDTGRVTQTEKSGMSEAVELRFDGLIQLFFSMSMNIAPKR